MVGGWAGSSEPAPGCLQPRVGHLRRRLGFFLFFPNFQLIPELCTPMARCRQSSLAGSGGGNGTGSAVENQRVCREEHLL